MKSLILADIHSNLAALQAVLEEEKAWDEIIFLGDAVIGGPQPNEVLSELSRHKGVFLMGNHDRQALDISLSMRATDPHTIWAQWTRRVITPENRDFLASFCEPCVIERDGLEMRLFHGENKAALRQRMWPDSPDEAYEWLVAKFPEPILLTGHVHVQSDRMFGRTRIINPGGVGQPRLREPVAAYAVLQEGEFDLRAVPYDTEKTAEAMGTMSLPEDFIEEWKQCYRQGELPGRYEFRDFSALRESGYR